MTFKFGVPRLFIHNFISFLLVQISCLSVSTHSTQVTMLPTCNRTLHNQEITVTAEKNHRNFNTTARLEWTALKCRNSVGMKRRISIDHYPAKSETCPHEMSDDFFTEDGYLTTKEGNYSHFYSPDDYCIHSVNSSKIEIELCEPSCEGSRPCITKCCHHLKVLDYNNYRCVDANSSQLYSPYFYSDPYTETPLNTSHFRPHFMHRLFNCTQETFYMTTLQQPSSLKNASEKMKHQKTRFKLLEDGSLLYVGGDRKWVLMTPDSFCIDAITNYDTHEFSEVEGRGFESEQVVFSCLRNHQTSQFHISALYMGSLYVAAIFLLLTCVVYLLLWQEQNVHGWTVFSLVSSMFFMFIFLATAHLYGLLSQEWKTKLKEASLCWLNGVLAHFFYLSTFCWLSTINFDLWLTFRSNEAMSGRSKGHKKFLVYALLSWGLPSVVISTGLILQRLYPNDDNLVLVPDYAEQVCFLAPWAQGEYLYYIISVLLLLNLAFIGATFHSLYQIKKVTGVIRSNKAENQNETFFLVAKLCVVMGVTWIFDVITWRLYHNVGSYIVIMDVWNFFQAVLIFIIFICKKNIKSQLQQKYPLFKKIFTYTASSTADSRNIPLTHVEAPRTNIHMKGVDNPAVCLKS